MDEESNEQLFRIIGFDRLVQIFESRKLHFSHPSKWDDPYEQSVEHPAMNSAFAQCWCLQGVSDAMWRIYSPDRLGVRIETTWDLLREQLSNSLKDAGFRKKIDRVRYVTEDGLKERLIEIKSLMGGKDKPTHALTSLFLKRKPFEHESEFRAVIYDERGGRGSIEKGLQVSVDPHELILTVLVDPRAPHEFVEAYKHYITNVLGFTGIVKQSGLYESIEPIPFC